MKIGIISDSHDSHKNVLKAVKIFIERKVDYILHAGDIVSPSTAEVFAEVEGTKFIAVFGNCDGEKIALEHTVKSFGGEIYEHFYAGEIGGKRIFMAHRPSTAAEAVKSSKYDVVIHGHTHERDIRRVGDTLIINPGKSRSLWTGKAGVVVLDLDDMSVEEILLK